MIELITKNGKLLIAFGVFGVVFSLHCNKGPDDMIFALMATKKLRVRWHRGLAITAYLCGA